MDEHEKIETTLNISIDHLIIDGMDFTRQERRLLQSAAESTLRDLFAREQVTGSISSLSSARCIQGEPIHLSMREAGPASLGKQIATSIYHSLAKQ